MTDHDKMVELAYDAVEDPGRWKAFLRAFCEALNGDHAILSILYAERGEFDVTWIMHIPPG